MIIEAYDKDMKLKGGIADDIGCKNQFLYQDSLLGVKQCLFLFLCDQHAPEIPWLPFFINMLTCTCDSYYILLHKDNARFSAALGTTSMYH